MMQMQGNSWLVPLADLSLILFVVTGVTLAASIASSGASEGDEPTPSSFREGVPAAVHIDSPNGPSLTDWLADYRSDPSVQLTIRAHYAAGQRSTVEARAEVLAQASIAAGVEPRVVIEPGEYTQVLAVFAYDRDPQVAQTLQDGAGE